jgi:AraC-like DNA-binding protein
MTPIARYREFDPCLPLRDWVRCFFTFSAPAAADELRRPIRLERLFNAPEVYGTPLFADSSVSISFSFGRGYRVDGLWTQAEELNCGHVIGPMSGAHPASHGDRIIEVGAYFWPMRAKAFFQAPAYQMADRILHLSELWGRDAISVESQIAEARCDDHRVERLERALLNRLHTHPHRRLAVNLPALADFIQRRRGVVTVGELAGNAGVSRQHLGRIFHEEGGLSPKLFCRLARFRAALACGAERVKDSGAGLAAEFGYTDQSHMIAEFREFSGLTPKPLLLRQRVHPFADASAGGV